jgi:hypothetical protein
MLCIWILVNLTTKNSPVGITDELSESYYLLTQTKFGDDLLISVEVFVLEVFEESFATSNHLNKTTTSHVVMLVRFQVSSHLFDASRQY